VPQDRTDSDLDDVWSDESGDVDKGAELTEFDFNPPSSKKAAPPKRQPPMTSDLQAPVLGALPEALPPPPPSKAPTLPVGAVLEGSSASLLTDVRIEKVSPPEKENRTMIGDAESAAIARAVSRSLLTGVVVSPAVPAVLEREDVHKVLMGKRDESPTPSSPPPPPGMPPPPPPAEPLQFVDDDPPTEPPTDPPLELAYDPHTPSPVKVTTGARTLPPPRQSTFSMKWILIGLGAVVVIAVFVRFFVRS
jgi:hypothetical protein